MPISAAQGSAPKGREHPIPSLPMGQRSSPISRVPSWGWTNGVKFNPPKSSQTLHSPIQPPEAKSTKIPPQKFQLSQRKRKAKITISIKPNRLSKLLNTVPKLRSVKVKGMKRIYFYWHKKNLPLNQRATAGCSSGF